MIWILRELRWYWEKNTKEQEEDPAFCVPDSTVTEQGQTEPRFSLPVSGNSIGQCATLNTGLPVWPLWFDFVAERKRKERRLCPSTSSSCHPTSMTVPCPVGCEIIKAVRWTFEQYYGDLVVSGLNSSHLSHLLLSLQSTDLSLEILNMFIPTAKQYKTQTSSTQAEKFTRCRDSARLLMEAYDSASPLNRFSKRVWSKTTGFRGKICSRWLLGVRISGLQNSLKTCQLLYLHEICGAKLNVWSLHIIRQLSLKLFWNVLPAY